MPTQAVDRGDSASRGLRFVPVAFAHVVFYWIMLALPMLAQQMARLPAAGAVRTVGREVNAATRD